MQVIKSYIRLYTDDLDSAMSFYENLLDCKTEFRFRYREMDLEIAAVGHFLILEGSPKALEPFLETKATLIVDSLEEFKERLLENGSEVVRDIKEVPTGKNMTMKHPDGSTIEYVQFFNQ
ncbi:VOC family protein [Klebsiella pneumoniae]|nr:VOC family protein [Klebsiella pneumoniae]